MKTSDPTYNDEAVTMGLSEIIKSINTAVVSPGKFSEEERREAVSACERLRASLETPLEGVIRRMSTVFLNLICF